MKDIYGNGGGGGGGGRETGKNAVFDKRGNRLTGAARERELARRAAGGKGTKGGRGVAAAKKTASRASAPARKTAPAKKTPARATAAKTTRTRR